MVNGDPMRRVWSLIGLLSGISMIAMGGVHSIMGWPQARAGLEGSGASDQLLRGLAVPWHFTGGAMTTAGIIVLIYFVALWRHQRADPTGARLVGLFYFVFGLWALVVVEPSPFFLTFLIPGMIALLGTIPGIALSARAGDGG
jgi:hypothetical protein